MILEISEHDPVAFVGHAFPAQLGFGNSTSVRKKHPGDPDIPFPSPLLSLLRPVTRDFMHNDIVENAIHGTS